MLSKEEIEKAKEKLKLLSIGDFVTWFTTDGIIGMEIATGTLLQYIDQLEQENKTLKHTNKTYKRMLNKQSKIIDEMAKEITEETLDKRQWCPLINKIKGCYEDDTCLKCLKQYFEKKVEGE